ncbi:hypothetical protein ACFSQJ_11055 [Croceitalea marina]|uniref:Uncharacterized protein n=1 Tax=Croceitalea marina TaxID=1775166 RepID=A0ABW5MWS7_9FLAO
MKYYLYTTITLTLCMPFIVADVLYPLNTVGNKPDLGRNLSSDYKDLTDFSESIATFIMKEESFNRLFWEGLIKSYSFYSSSEYIEQSTINDLIETRLWSNPDLKHSFKKPEINRTNFLMAFNALNSFSGKWHGKWETMKMHHLWLPVRKCNTALFDSFTLVGFQSCYTGDGIGWNYVLKKEDDVIILGFVYHFNDNGKIFARNPHYAFLNSKKQLTWVSDNHIYYEFVCTNSTCANEQHYVITGAQYEKNANGIELISGFQAIYLDKNQLIPDFQSLCVEK